MKLNHETHGPHGHMALRADTKATEHRLAADTKTTRAFRARRVFVHFRVRPKASPPFCVPQRDFQCVPWLFQTAAPNLRLGRVPLATRRSSSCATAAPTAVREGDEPQLPSNRPHGLDAQRRLELQHADERPRMRPTARPPRAQQCAEGRPARRRRSRRASVARVRSQGRHRPPYARRARAASTRAHSSPHPRERRMSRPYRWP